MKLKFKVLVWLVVGVRCAGAANVSDELFVRLNDPLISWRALERKFGVQVIRKSTLVPGLVRVRVRKDIDLELVISEMNALPGVVYVEPNYVVHRSFPVREELRTPVDPFKALNWAQIFFPTEFMPNDPGFSAQWALNGLKGIHPLAAWALTRGSPEVKVAVIDTGVMSDHPDLKGNVLPGYDFIGQKSEVIDTEGHGTHVSGIIAAKINNGLGVAGIAGDSKIIPIRAIPNDSDETDDHVIQALEFAVTSGARVANCSFGKAESSQAVGDTLKAVGERGLFVVATGGNDHHDLTKYTNFPGDFHTPNMIVVTASNANGELAEFADYGLKHIDIAAPGDNIYSTFIGGTYQLDSGTSMAAPMVTATVALMLSVNPKLSPVEIRKILMETVDKDPALADRVDAGGRLNTGRAVQRAAQEMVAN